MSRLRSGWKTIHPFLRGKPLIKVISFKNEETFIKSTRNETATLYILYLVAVSDIPRTIVENLIVHAATDIDKEMVDLKKNFKTLPLPNDTISKCIIEIAF